MKSIEDTLNLINNIADALSGHDKLNIALVGGYAVIAHGVGRTTADVDFCVYAESIRTDGISAFTKLLEKAVPDTFEVQCVEGSRIADDPFQHDVIFIDDKSGEYPRIDFIVAKYKWELEGTQASKPLEDIPFPVLPKPYLVAMKLKAGSIKDDYDITELYELMTEDEKAKTAELARLIHRDKKLAQLTTPRSISLEEDDDLLLSDDIN